MEALAAVDGLRFSDWWEDRQISRSTAFKLLTISGVELEKRKVDGSRAPVSFIKASDLGPLDFLANQTKEGKTLAELETKIVEVKAKTEPAQTVQDSPQHLQAPEHLLQRLQAAQLAVQSGLGLTTAEASWILGVRPGAAVVVRGGVVAERQSRNHWKLSAAG